MKKLLANAMYGDESTLPSDRRAQFDAEKRESGMDWPERAHTMVGLKRLDNVRHCVQSVLERGVAASFATYSSRATT